ncbi:hypothetical protein RAS1_02390 [Phycisphaerae bacterium RAS1]|nr:hypothetical protein RAS1_02390 [Phycisphaerae bacterium RAS1]
MNLPRAEKPLPHSRAWFVLYLLWLGGLAALSIYFFQRYDGGDGAGMRGWLLALMCFYLSLCNVMFPLPTSWIVLLAASSEFGVVADPLRRIALIAVAGGLSTVMANLNEYHVLGVLMRYGVGERIRASRVYAWAIRWFNVSPFRTLLLVSFVPIPIDAVRWLAILRRYPRLRFAAAYFAGRCARYALLAGLSVQLRLTPVQIVIIQIAIVLLLAARLLYAALGGLLRRRPGVDRRVALDASSAAPSTRT